MPAERVTTLSPWHVVIVVDDSLGGEGQASTLWNDVLRGFLSELEVIHGGRRPYFMVSVIGYGDSVEILAECLDAREINPEDLAVFRGGRGRALLGEGLRAARELLQRHPGRADDFRPYVFVLRGAGLDDDRGMLIECARELKEVVIPAGSPKVAIISLPGSHDEVMEVVASRSEFALEVGEGDEVCLPVPLIGSVYSSKSGEDVMDDCVMSLFEDDGREFVSI